MKLHILTIGKPKLGYAQAGWHEYLGRLTHLHAMRITHLADKYASDSGKILAAAHGTYLVALDVAGEPLTSHELAAFLRQRELAATEVTFVIGGPDGLPEVVLAAASYRWRLSKLTLPHDLAMVVVAEALYRAATINAGRPYHK